MNTESTKRSMGCPPDRQCTIAGGTTVGPSPDASEESGMHAHERHKAPENSPIEPIVAARMNEERQALATRDLGDEAVSIAGGVATYGEGVDWVNHATLVGFDEDVPDAELDAMEAFYRERGQVPKLEITTFTTEAFLAQLAARSYCVEHFENVLTRPLRADEDPVTESGGLPEGLAISRTDATCDEACREHAVLVSSGFITPPIPEPHIDMAIRSIRHPRSAGFVAHVGGEPAGACGMEVFEFEGVKACALWGTTVLEPLRRRGIQRALIAHRLAFAIERGCGLAFIESKPGIPTERNAARLGFGLSYVRVCLAKGGEVTRS
jgi:GNAT superfamily N-acetyltransferase